MYLETCLVSDKTQNKPVDQWLSVENATDNDVKMCKNQSNSGQNHWTMTLARTGINILPHILGDLTMHWSTEV